MRKDIELIEAENNSKEIQARNHLRLSEEVQSLLVIFFCVGSSGKRGVTIKLKCPFPLLQRKLDLPREYIISLDREKFSTTEGLTKIVFAVKMLEEALEGEFKEGMYKMAAVGERIEHFQTLRKKLVNRLREFLKDEFVNLSTKMLDRMKSEKLSSKRDPLKLDPHTAIYDVLQSYFPLMKSVKSSDFGAHLDLRKSYETAMSIIYKKELMSFALEVKAQIKKDRDSVANNGFLIGVSESNLSSKLFKLYMKANKGSAASNNLDVSDEMSDNESVVTSNDSDSSLRGDRAYLLLLNTICDISYREQRFCSTFFDLNPQLELTSGFKELRMMLERMMRGIPKYFAAFIDSFERHSDKFFSLIMLIATELKIASYKTRSAFITAFLEDSKGKLLEVFQRFVKMQVNSIDEYKSVIKKSGVIPCVAKLPYFVDRFQLMIQQGEDMEEGQGGQSAEVAAGGAGAEESKQLPHAEMALTQLVSRIFEKIDALAETDPKHSNAFKIKNYCYFYRAMLQRNFSKMPEMQKRVKESQDIFSSCSDKYIQWVIRDKAFTDLFKFFSGIEEALATKTFPVEDIKTKNVWNKAELQKLSSSNARNFQSKIKEMVKRLDRHLGPKSETNSYVVIKIDQYNLYFETWRRLVTYFLDRYKGFHEVTKMCYENIKLEPSWEEAKKAFDLVESSVSSFSKASAGYSNNHSSISLSLND